MGMTIEIRFHQGNLAFPILAFRTFYFDRENAGLNTTISNINETSMHAVQETHALLADL